MEPTDQTIVSLLAEDGRMSFTDIGKKVGLSTSATQQRVRRLEQRGVITGYHAEIDPAAVGRVLTAFIEIHSLTGDPEQAATDYLDTLPQITACYAISGSASYMCMAEIEGPEALDSLLSQIRRDIGANTVTSIVLRTVFRHRSPIG